MPATPASCDDPSMPTTVLGPGAVELWVMEADGTNPVAVLDPPAEIGGYDWVP
jgi:hypothetical protein